MRKVFKIILAVFLVLVIVAAVLVGLVLLDVPAYTATNSQTLTPSGALVGNALVVYDPGFTGAAKTVAEKVAYTLQSNGYKVTLAGIKSNAISSSNELFEIIVAGGPIYAGGPTASVKDFLSSLGNPMATVGVFGSGSGPQEQADIDQIKNAIAVLPNGEALSDAIIVKIGNSEDINQRTLDFVNDLIR